MIPLSVFVKSHLKTSKKFIFGIVTFTLSVKMLNFTVISVF